MPTETFTEVVSFADALHRLREVDEPDDRKGQPDPKTGNKQPPEPSEATRDMLKALPDAMRNLIEEYRDWIITVGSSPSLGHNERGKKIDELMLDFHLKAMKLPQAEAAESKVAKWFRDAGCGDVITESVVADIARVVRRGDEGKAKLMAKDWIDLATRSGQIQRINNVKTRDDAMALLRS